MVGGRLAIGLMAYFHVMLLRFFNWRTLLTAIALAIVAGTIIYARYLAGKLETEERQRVEEWVMASRVLQSTTESNALTLANAISVNNEDIPLIATDENGAIADHRNIDSSRIAADSGYLQRRLSQMKSSNPPIDWLISDSPRMIYKVYYGESALQRQLKFYPVVQLVIVALFVILLLSLMTLRSKSQQNLVWAGMAKETAHQMGTPLTSLQGWVEMLKESGVAQQIVEELEKDVDRLKLVSDRFGKIGSQPQLEETDLASLVTNMVAYMKRRAPGRVVFVTNGAEEPLYAMVSPTLLNWVLENLLKNALDALEGKGAIVVVLHENSTNVYIDVTDNGKGISPENLRKVFAPGFTTKKRGWGLGLTLSRRIMEQYHKGELYVKHSETGKGTTFRMVIRKH